MAATLILAGVIAYGVTAYAQPAGGGKPDPVKVDPKHYKVTGVQTCALPIYTSYCTSATWIVTVA